ncbi:MAG: hypothetical protein U0469_00110 [Candidatus Paceibacterota bacterium]
MIESAKYTAKAPGAILSKKDQSIDSPFVNPESLEKSIELIHDKAGMRFIAVLSDFDQ